MSLLNLRSFSAIIFDLDGVLIDSMRRHVLAWQEVFRSFGVEIQPQEILLREGEKAGLTAALLAKKYGMQWTLKDLENAIKVKRDIYQKEAPKNLRPVARQAIEVCKSFGQKIAIVTGSVRGNLEAVLSLEELQLFDVIVTADDVTLGKPHPEPFLKAAELLAIPPQKCLVIENAPLGIRSAKAAGMTCIAVATTLPPEELKGADKVISDLDKLAEV